MIVVTEHTERILDQEIDTVQICPSSSDHMMVGTYSLVTASSNTCSEPDDGQNGSEQSSTPRLGSVRVLLVNYHAKSTPSAIDIPQQFRLDLPCAVLDLRFCPTDDTLVGAATSIGELRFFRLLGVSQDSVSGLGRLEVVPVGIARLSEQHEDNRCAPALITQFLWLHSQKQPGRGTETDCESIHYLAACDTLGHTILVEVAIPNVGSKCNSEVGTPDNPTLRCKTRIIHKHLHDLEAWTIAAINLSSENTTLRQILLSGGDDSCLITSAYTLKLDSPSNDTNEDDHEIQFDCDPTRLHLDKQTHTAGVVAIYPLPPLTSTALDVTSSAIPILTGSYDQHLRLILFDTTTMEFTPTSSIELEGGVWRITLIDRYVISSAGTSQGQPQLHYLLLVSAMYSGWYIVRLIKDLNMIEATSGWSWQIDNHQSKPHESMVYACAAVKGHKRGTRDGHWQVVTTSFYDKRICVWEVEDVIRARL